MPGKIKLAEGAIREIEDKIKQKEAVLASTEKNFLKADEECKAIARMIVAFSADVKKAELAVKAAGKDKTKLTLANKKLADLKKAQDNCMKKGVELDKKRQMIQAAPDQAKLAIIQLEKDLVVAKKKLDVAKEEVKKGIADYGKARSDYLLWWAGEEGKMNTLLKEAEGFAATAVKGLEATDAALNQGKADVAKTQAQAAQTAAAKAGETYNKVDKMIQGWHTTWDTQRNLKPSAFGVETEDVKVHAGVTSKVYDTFQAGDACRDKAKKFADEAAQAGEEAMALAAAGAKDRKFYDGVVARAKTGLKKLIEDYNKITTAMWGKVIAEEGGSLKKFLTIVQTNRETGLAGALKAVEQGKQILPRTMNSARSLVKQIGAYVSQEVKKIPVDFQRVLKSETDKMRMDAMKVIQQLSVYEGKYKKAMDVLEKLEQATL